MSHKLTKVQLLRKTPVIWRNFKPFSTTPKTILVTVNDKTGVTTLTLQNPPVNSLDLQLLTEFGDVLTHLEQNKSRGVILTSGMPNVFCAGLNLLEFYNPDIKKLETFWRTLQNTWLKLYTCSFPTVALINGHSPAGGCLLAMSCEYRVMVGRQYTIGLNETKIGLPAPFWFMDVMRNTIGHRKSELSLSAGALNSADDALSMGLVDFVSDDEAEAVEKVNDFFNKQHKVDAGTRAIMKKEFRQDVVDKYEKRKEQDVQFVIAGTTAPETQKKLEGYIRAMKKKLQQ